MIIRKTAKDVLAESLKDISRTKTADKITVREIAQNCGYSTATFYREFHDKYDLMMWDYRREVDRIMAQIGDSGRPWNWSLLAGAQYFHEHREYLVNLLSHTVGQDSFENCMIEVNARALREYLDRIDSNIMPDRDLDLYIRLYCAGTVRLCCEWLTGKFAAEPAELAGIWEHAVPDPLRLYLYTA